MKNNLIFNKSLAFTLAEVLIVVAILGVTAVLTIPNLSTGIEEDKVVTKIKSTVGMLDAAIAQVMYEHPNDINDRNNINSSSNFCSHISEHLKIGKNCGKDGGCFNEAAPSSAPGISDECDEIEERDDFLCSFILDNGVSVAITEYGMVFLNINGLSGGNVMGQDLFRGHIDKNGSITFYNGFEAGEDSSMSFDIEYQPLMWIIKNGNMDYLKCSSSLNWRTQTTCP